jgi:hypothetical protein
MRVATKDISYLEAWKRQFIRDLFPHSASKRHIERAFAVKDRHVPSTLYKYRHFSEDHLDALNRNVLWLSSPARLNDPYEATVSFDLDRFWVEDHNPEEFLEVFENQRKRRTRSKPQPLLRPIRSVQWRNKIFNELAGAMDPASKQTLLTYIEEFFQQHHNDQVRRMGEAFRRNFSVLSLSENCSSTLMWAHYSDGHKGFCVEYALSNLPSDDLRRRLCFPVFYTKKPRDVTRYLSRTDMADYNNLFGLFMCLVKRDEWNYEREWRIVDSIGARKANREIAMPNPSGILLGLNVTGGKEAAMRTFCRERKIPLRKTTQLAGSFELGFVDLPL